MTNRELFNLDPTGINLKNEGVAKLRALNDTDDLSIVEYELRTFVCEGEYYHGLKKILHEYLTHLGNEQMPAFWVSGFYGSGKSHLVKMASYLWDDFQFPDGRTARTIKALPQDLQDLLTELARIQKIHGKFVVAGTLRDFPNRDIRYSFLQLMLQAMGLPTQYHHFRFVHWLRAEEILEGVKAILESAGRDLHKEVSNLHVSLPLAKAVLELKPEMAESGAKILQLFKENFKRVETIGREDFIRAVRSEILPIAYGDKIPCTLIVLDEIQQFIGQDAELANDVQFLAEDLCSRFDGKFLLVGTGQNALSETPMLQRLMARLPVKIELGNTDIQTVIRKTILEKKPTAILDIDRKLESSLGEISRNLQGSIFSYTLDDHKTLVADYPVLPSTRKFWSTVLQVVDVAGTQGQLRNQLRLVDESLKSIATQDLGRIVPADFIFTQLRSLMIQSGLLLNDTSSVIQGKKSSDDPDEQLCGRILSAVFLLDQVTAKVHNTGLKSNAQTIADLLVDNLNENSEPFRSKVAELILKLVGDRNLMPVDDEIKLQTKVGAEWEQAYQQQYIRLNSSGEDKIMVERKDQLLKYLREKTNSIHVTQGTSQIGRVYELWDKAEAPKTEIKLHLWLRDGWRESGSLVESEIRAAGVETPLAYLFIKKLRDQELRSEILKYLAADATLIALGHPGTLEGDQARRSMETRRNQAKKGIEELVDKIFEEATVYLAGGTAIRTGSLKDNIQDALRSIADRQFPEFRVKADHGAWNTALNKAKNGQPDALTAVGHQGDASRHPIAVDILRYLGNATKTGNEIRKHFLNSPYGWPQDAIDAVLYSLKNAEVVSCNEPDLTGTKFNQAAFKKEVHTLSASDRMDLRTMLQRTSINVPPNRDIFPYTNDFLNILRDLATNASGEPPRPEPFKLDFLRDIEAKDGNERLLDILAQKEHLETLYNEWREKAALVREREPQWQKLQELATHAAEEPGTEDLIKDVQAIRDDRLLLQEPDLIQPTLQELAEKMMAALNARKQRFNAIYDEHMTRLQEESTFSRLTPEQKHVILGRHRILRKADTKMLEPAVLVNQLNNTSLTHWDTKISALPGQFQEALEEAARLSAPKAQTYTLPKKTLSSAAEIDEYVNTLRSELEELLKTAPSIILK